jgi:hypothetical protein
MTGINLVHSHANARAHSPPASGAPVVAVVRRPALRASPRPSVDSRVDRGAAMTGVNPVHSHANARAHSPPASGAPVVAVVRCPALRASPRPNADSRGGRGSAMTGINPVHSHTNARAQSPPASGAPVVAVVRRPALRASPRPNADSRVGQKTHDAIRVAWIYQARRVSRDRRMAWSSRHDAHGDATHMVSMLSCDAASWTNDRHEHGGPWTPLGGANRRSAVGSLEDSQRTTATTGAPCRAWKTGEPSRIAA